MILNELDTSQTKFKGDDDRFISVKVDSEYKDIKVPIGYGISPFLKLHVLLQLVWKYLGFNLIENPFREDFQLSSICVLNNTWDTIVAGEIRYSDLMPDCTIEDILSMVWGKFGAVYFVDSNTKNVRIKLIKDILHIPNSQSQDPNQKKEKISAYRYQKETWNRTLRFLLYKHCYIYRPAPTD